MDEKSTEAIISTQQQSEVSVVWHGICSPGILHQFTWRKQL